MRSADSYTCNGALATSAADWTVLGSMDPRQGHAEPRDRCLGSATQQELHEGGLAVYCADARIKRKRR